MKNPINIFLSITLVAVAAENLANGVRLNRALKLHTEITALVMKQSETCLLALRAMDKQQELIESLTK